MPVIVRNERHSGTHIPLSYIPAERGFLISNIVSETVRAILKKANKGIVVTDEVMNFAENTADELMHRAAGQEILEFRDFVGVGELIGIFVEDYFSNLSYNRPIKSERPTNAKSAAFNAKSQPELSVPQDELPVPYPGKRSAGDVREFLARNYPYREGAEPLTLGWLEGHDPKAYRALYTQSTAETGPPSNFLTNSTTAGDELLKRHGLDLDSPEGLEEARRLYGLLNGRLYPRRQRT